MCELVAHTGITITNRISTQRFAEYLNREGMGWPGCSVERTRFAGFIICHDGTGIPQKIGSIRQVRRALSRTRLFDGITVGPDNRNRCGLSMFGQRQSTHTIKCKIFARDCSMGCGLIKPEPAPRLHTSITHHKSLRLVRTSVVMKMIAAYESGDPYLALAKFAGAAPPDATKQSHKEVRHLFKAVVLGVGFGMSQYGLADRIDQPLPYAKELLRHHHEQFADYWEWVDAAIGVAMAKLSLPTCFNWQLHIGRPTTIDDKPTLAHWQFCVTGSWCGNASVGCRLPSSCKHQNNCPSARRTDDRMSN